MLGDDREEAEGTGEAGFTRHGWEQISWISQVCLYLPPVGHIPRPSPPHAGSAGYIYHMQGANIDRFSDISHGDFLCVISYLLLVIPVGGLPVIENKYSNTLRINTPLCML